ncbi:MAG: succinate CoA transferase [Verrucomicrobiota bacterium JB022]|nr:succinate CoA transferase [Verrucomicrobiota bacterium JB022]
MPYTEMTPEEAASLIQHGQTIGFSGFTPAGAAKVVSRALAARARAEHEAGRPFQVGVVTGASTGQSLDGVLAEADAIAWRTPYQSNGSLRKAINEGRTRFFDMHLSLLQQWVRYGFLGKFHWAIVEAAEVTPDGEITLTSSVGAANTFLNQAEKVIIEINRFHPKSLYGLHDIYEPEDPPRRREIPVFSVRQRCGSPVVKIDPNKIVGVVYNDMADEVAGFKDSDPITNKIGQNVADFLAAEMRAGRIPREFLPIQSGVGNIANAVLGAMGEHPEIPAFEMYSEVIQDSVIGLMEADRIKFASGTSLTINEELMRKVYDNFDFFRRRMILRPQEISNNPEVVRRLGVITINTAIEVDIFGNVNSTHIMGNDMMNGIGGSGDFTRNAYISVFTCPSLAKKGAISPIVPLCSHLDHSEHSVQVVVTEQGVADLRGKDPHERALEIINKCAHPDYRDVLRGYSKDVQGGHTPQTLDRAFKMHQRFLETGSMAGTEWSSK